MQLKKLAQSRLVTVVAAAAAVALIGAGAGYSAGQITGAQIKNGTVASKDIKDKTLKTKDLNDKTIKALQGQTGPAGNQGPPGPAGSGESVVATATGQWSLHNANGAAAITPDGVLLGPYANAGTNGSSICFSGLNGQTVGSIRSVSYLERHRVDNPPAEEGVASPYFRIFIGNNDHDIIYSENTQDTVFGPGANDDNANEFNQQVVTQGSVRYDDDGENVIPDLTWAALKAAHSTEVIGGNGICISQGFAGGFNASALIPWLEINGTTYRFRSAS